jgi:DHA2 family multidrug resistance protein
MMIVGSLLFASGTWRMTFMTADWDFWELFWPQVCRGVGMMATMIPVQNVALGTLPLDRVKNASGLFNLMRNLGGAIGLAGINTILNDRTDLHLARLHERLTWAHQPALERLDQMTQRLQDRSDAADMALKQMMQLAHQQAVVMAFADVLLLLTAIFVALAAMSLLLRKPGAASPAADAGH